MPRKYPDPSLEARLERHMMRNRSGILTVSGDEAGYLLACIAVAKAAPSPPTQDGPR